MNLMVSTSSLLFFYINILFFMINLIYYCFHVINYLWRHNEAAFEYYWAETHLNNKYQRHLRESLDRSVKVTIIILYHKY